MLAMKRNIVFWAILVMVRIKTYNAFLLLAFKVLLKRILVFEEVDIQIKMFYLFCNNNNTMPGLNIIKLTTPLMIDIKSLNIFQIKIHQSLIFMNKKTS